METVHVHLASVDGDLSRALSAGKSAPKRCDVPNTMRTFVVGATSDNTPVNILAQVGSKRRALLFTNSLKVVVTSEYGEASAAVGTGGGNGVQLPNTTTTGSPIELLTTGDVWAVSSDGTPQTIGVICEFWSE